MCKHDVRKTLLPKPKNNNTKSSVGNAKHMARHSNEGMTLARDLQTEFSIEMRMGMKLLIGWLVGWLIDWLVG